MKEIQVERSLKQVKACTTAGHDGLSATLIKKLAPALTPNVTQIFNSCISTSVFPDCWKMANISAIWKNKGAKNDVSNYRPISVLPILSRIFEKMLSNQLGNFCEINGLIPKEQFGFRAKSSCETALAVATDKWMSEVDKGMFVGVILIDLSKAFDSVNHLKLIKELSSLQLCASTIRLFQSFLDGRIQRVVCGGASTEWKSINRGVPQGSCLSPLLFNIYVRRLPNEANCDVCQFADDVTESASGSTIEEVKIKLTDSFNRTKAFCDTLDLSINCSKTQFIIFKQPAKGVPESFHLDLDGISIKPCKEAELLGFKLDRHFTFAAHIDSVILKARGTLGMLRRVSKWLPRELTKLAYMALIRNNLEYCSIIFANAASTHLQKLETVQRIAARIICSTARDSHAAPLLELLDLPSLESRRDKRLLKVAADIVLGSCHPALLNSIEFNEESSVVIPTSRTIIGSRRVSVTAARTLIQALDIQALDIHSQL